jgi:hypothetical protein
MGVAGGLLAPSSALALSESDWLGRINEIRQGSQLPPVVDEPAWSAGILAHERYLRGTPPSYTTGSYESLHTENPASPFYTPEGAKEAESSDLGSGDTNVEAIDDWLAAPFHAIGMLRPGLKRVAFARSPGSGNAGLDVISGLEEGEHGVPARQVLFPGADSTIDLARYGGESPPPTETCEQQHPGADYDGAGLPLIALLTAPAETGLSATLGLPDGGQISSSGADLCIVTADNFVTRDTVYGPTGHEILSGDKAVFVIPRQPLVAGRYTADISQPGKPDIVWSFNSQPRIAPNTSPKIELRVRNSVVHLNPDPVLLGHTAKVAIQRNWVPCALRLTSPICVWVKKGRTLHSRLQLSQKAAIRFRRPGRWERVAIHVRTNGFVLDTRRYYGTSAAVVVKGPKPHHAAR